MSASCGIYEALWLARLHHASAQALYMHLPFCVHKCLYCDFASWTTPKNDPLIDAYVSSLVRLFDEAVAIGLLEGCETAYIGGGTPTLAGSALAGLVSSIRAGLPRLTEFTSEANPDSLSDSLLEELAGAGCTRISLGVQSLDDEELRLLGRVHSAERAIDRLRAAVSTGLDVSADLMCAIPAQTDQSWKRTVERVIASGVGHVSVYPLQIEEGTPFDRQYGETEASWNDTEVQACRMELAETALAEQGFTRYEVASYALRGKECQHNEAYWTAKPYLGLGTNASSMLTREGYERLREAVPQLPSLPPDVRRVRLTCINGRREIADAKRLSALLFDLELMNDGQAAAEDLMLAMRMTSGAGPGLIAHARATLGGSKVDDAFEWCVARGLVEQHGSSWVPTSEGWLLGNELYGRLWDLAPEGVEGLSI